MRPRALSKPCQEDGQRLHAGLVAQQMFACSGILAVDCVVPFISLYTDETLYLPVLDDIRVLKEESVISTSVSWDCSQQGGSRCQDNEADATIEVS